MRHRNHGRRALAQGQAGELGHTVLRRQYWTMPRGAEIVLPPGIAATMLDLRLASFAFLAEVMQMKPLPPSER